MDKEKKENVYTLTVPFSNEEKKRFLDFTKTKGLKKGVFAKKALLHYMERFASDE
jgi:hypothetical protein